ncbi:MAG TPA: DNA alkylation repair protein [Anaerolineae bacterium]|nr:DNA alkylation repair protein [Anaerolineae bacterium]
MPEIESLLADLPAVPNPAEVLTVVERAFETFADRGDYGKMIRVVVPGVEKVYGVRVPVLRKLGKGIRAAYKQDQAALEALALESWARGSREHEILALVLLKYVKELTPAERWSMGLRFLPRVKHWEACDQLCGSLLGDALAQDAGYMDELETWIEDDNFWIRRAALVTTVLLRRSKHPPEVALDLDRRTLAMCEALLDDREGYIRKAVDWAIRETIKRRYDLGCEWMMTQALSNPSRTARSTLKLASKKLDDADRQAFLSKLGV